MATKTYIYDGSLNDQLRILGGEVLLEEGVVRRTITLALQDVGIEKPYKLVETETKAYQSEVRQTIADVENEQSLAEIEWVFGAEAEQRMQKLAEEAAGTIASQPELLEEEHLSTRWGHLSIFDEGEFLEALELRLETAVKEGIFSSSQAQELEKRLEKRRHEVERRLNELDPHALRRFREHQDHFHEYMKNHHPEEFQRIQELQKRWKEK